MTEVRPADTCGVESSSKHAAIGARERTPRRAAAGRGIRFGAVLAVALAVAFGAWLLLLRDDGGSASPAGPVSTAVSRDALRALPGQTGHPVYWAGPRARHIYELTRPTDGSVYLRYLPAGVRIGDRRPAFTTIGTYPRRGALRVLRRLGRQRGMVTFPLGGGGIAVYSRARPTWVFVGFPGRDLHVVVYDPSPGDARRLARSGRVRPV
jgi:hypothetical protein